jgi:hypothetical protein
MLTPLFQTNFLPDLTQVYLIPDLMLVWDSLLQDAPGLTAAIATDWTDKQTRAAIRNARGLLRMQQAYLLPLEFEDACPAKSSRCVD